jgi:hypothetical protein
VQKKGRKVMSKSEMESYPEAESEHEDDEGVGLDQWLTDGGTLGPDD